MAWVPSKARARPATLSVAAGLEAREAEVAETARQLDSDSVEFPWRSPNEFAKTRDPQSLHRAIQGVRDEKGTHGDLFPIASIHHWDAHAASDAVPGILPVPSRWIFR